MFWNWRVIETGSTKPRIRFLRIGNRPELEKKVSFRMKAILEFDLPEEEELDAAVNAIA